MTYVTDHNIFPAAQPGHTLLLSTLMHRTAVDAAGQALGRLSDIIVRLRDETYPLVTGLVVHVGSRQVYVPATEILVWDEQRLELASARLDLRQFARRPGEVLLRNDVLGHRLVDVDQSRLVTARDVRLTHTGDRWQAVAVDIHPRGLLRRRSQHTWRDWSRVEALLGHDVSLPARARLGGLRRLKPEVLVLCDASASMTTRDIVNAGDTGAVSRAGWLAAQCARKFWAPLAPENRLMPRYCAKLKNEIAAILLMR